LKEWIYVPIRCADAHRFVDYSRPCAESCAELIDPLRVGEGEYGFEKVERENRRNHRDGCGDELLAGL
jgi:hypothetical protein